MLHLYRRHIAACPHTKWTYTRCQCPIYAKGTLAGRPIARRALDLTDWAAAQLKIGDWQKAGRVTDDDILLNVDMAVTEFLADLETRGLSVDTRNKYVRLLRTRLQRWCLHNGVEFIRDVTLTHLTKMRATWPDAPLAMLKNQERLKAFFAWCQRRKLIDVDPSDGLTKIQVKTSPTLPFTAEEMVRILEACDRYPVQNAYGQNNRARIKAFVLVLRWSGLRIRDAVTLSWDQIQDGKIRLYTQKTGQHVSVPVPAVVTDALEHVRTTSSLIFWSGNGQAKSAVADWQRSLRRLFELATVDGGHAHRFRDTFAVELLLAGVELSDVSVLLGHSSIKITEKHYSPWVASRQRRLESIVAQTFSPAPESNDPPASPQSDMVPCDDAAPALAPIGPWLPDAPDPRPTAECASDAQTPPRLARTGTDA